MKRTGALNKTVGDIVSNLRELQEEAEMTARADVDIDVRFAGLQQRVTGLEQAVQGVSTQISSLASTINERARTPWGILLTGAGVSVSILVILGGLAYAPVRDGLVRTDRDIIELRSNALSVASFLEFKTTYENNRITSRNDNDAKFAAAAQQTKADLARIEDQLKNIVPRGEHEQKWASYDNQIAAVQRQIDDLKTAIGSIYNARDVIMDLRERLDRVDRIRAGNGN